MTAPDAAGQAGDAAAGDPILRALAPLLIWQSFDPQYVVDLADGRFLMVNPAFERMHGFEPGEILRKGVQTRDLVVAEDWEGIEKRQRVWEEHRAETYEFRVQKKDGERRTVEASVRREVVNGRVLSLGVLRDVTERRHLESRLRAEVDLHRKRTLEAYQANVRIFQLTEKVRAAYDCTKSLAGCRTPEDLGARAIAVLTDPAGFDYHRAALYLVEGAGLVLQQGGDDARLPARLEIVEGSPSPLVRAMQEEDLTPCAEGVKAMRLRGREGTLGLLAVVEHPEAAAKAWQDSILLTLGGVLSLMLENLILYEKVEAESLIDPLTRLYNRRYFDPKLRSEFDRAARYGREISLLLLDLDGLKGVNDTQGHRQGDVVIEMAGKILEQRLRSIDVACRWGGDEFAILLPETPADRATQTAERLRETFTAERFPSLRGGEPVRMTISCGVAFLAPDTRDVATLLEHADRALYRAKAGGRNRVCAHESVKPA